MDVAATESTRLFRRLTARIQQDVPELVLAVGLFRNPRLNRLPMDLALGVTTDKVYVFAMGPFRLGELVDVWDRGGLRARSEENLLSWSVDVHLADGRRYHLAARRGGANRVNGDAVRLLTSPPEPPPPPPARPAGGVPRSRYGR